MVWESDVYEFFWHSTSRSERSFSCAAVSIVWPDTGIITNANEVVEVRSKVSIVDGVRDGDLRMLLVISTGRRYT
jgi:hypothetical protein